MIVSTSSRRHLSNGSDRARPSASDSESKPIRLTLRLSSPAQKDDGEGSNKETQPPRKPTSIRLRLATPTPSSTAGAPIIRPAARSREHIISESDISVLDLGPSLTQPHLHQKAPALSSPNGDRFPDIKPPARATEAGNGFPQGRTYSNRWTAQVIPSEANTRQSTRPRHAEEVKSEPVSSDDNVSPANDQSRRPLPLRHNQAELHPDLPSLQRFCLSSRGHQSGTGLAVLSSPGQGLRAPPRRPGRPNLTGDIHCLGYGYGFEGFEAHQDRSDFFIIGDEMSPILNPRSSTSTTASSGSQQAKRSRGTWRRRSWDLLTTGLSEFEQTMDLFPNGEGKGMMT